MPAARKFRNGPNGRPDYNLVPPDEISPKAYETFRKEAPLDPEYWREFASKAKEHLGQRCYLWLRRNHVRAQVVQMTLDAKTNKQITDRTGYVVRSIYAIQVTARKLGLIPPSEKTLKGQWGRELLADDW